jgi:nucleoside-diphosphate-sugar epimerase
MIAELMPPPDYAILRPSVVYGVGAPFAVPLVRSALFGPRARQFVQTLQWIHVEDVATALITCATTNRPLNKTFNIAGDETVSSDSLHEAIRQVAGMPQQPPMYGQNSAGFGQLPPKYDVTKARAAFDFRSAVPLAQGLPDMVRTALPEAMTAPSSMPGFGAWPDRTHQAGWGPGTRPGFGGFQGSGWWRR